MANFFDDARFYVWVLIFFAVRLALPAALLSPRVNRLFLALVSAFFIILLDPSGKVLGLTAALGVFVALVSELAASTKSESTRRAILTGSVACLVTNLVLVRLTPFHWVGLSYATFRAVDFLFRERGGRAPEETRVETAISFLAYLVLWIPFLAGPVNGFTSFRESTAKVARPGAGELQSILLRASLGIIKILFLSKLAFAHSIANVQRTDLDWPELWLRSYLYFFYVYFEFSGYTDCAISVAKAFGVELPENFDLPLAARNLNDFWNRWHISMSLWFRNNVYFPLLSWLSGLSGRRSGESSLVANLFSILSTFLAMGFWHGQQSRWVLYGAYHGIGVCAVTLYGGWMRTRHPAFAFGLASSRLYALACRVATFHFVTLGLLISLGKEGLIFFHR